MKKLDLTQLGGFPFDQDNLNWLQQGYTEPLLALAKMGGAGPYIVSGMELSGGNVAPGWICYAGELIPFVGGPVGATIVINTITEDLMYENGLTHPSRIRKEASWGTGPVQINWVDLKLFQQDFGLRGRSTGWVVLEDNSPSYKIEYLRNLLTGTVTIRGYKRHSIQVSGGNLPMQIMFGPALPTNILPSQDLYFRTNVETHLSEIREHTGAVYTGDVGRINVANAFISVSSRLIYPGDSTSFNHNFYFTYNID